MNGKSLIYRWHELRAFMGGQVIGLFLRASAVGFLVFGIESSFIFVFQGFLRAVGLVDDAKLVLPSWYPSGLVASLTLMALFGISRGTAFYLKSYLGGVTHQAFIRLQRSRILEYALHHAHEISTHEVVTVFSDRVVQAGGVLYGASGLVLTITSSLALFVLGMTFAPIEMILGVSLLTVFLYPLGLLNVAIRAASAGSMAESEAANRALIEGIRHHLFLKIYNLVPRQVQWGQDCLERFEQLYRHYYRVASLKFTVPMTVGVLVICLITWVSLTYIHTPSIQLVSFFYLFIRIAQGASDINSTFAETRLQIPAFVQLFEWYERYLRHEKAASAQAVQAPVGTAESLYGSVTDKGISVKLRGLSFGYPGQPALFKDLDLSIGRGEVLVIQGESGVGKSTLLSLMLGLLEPSGGSVVINDIPVKQVRPLLDRYVAYVGPEPHLIAGTVRSNLLYGHHSPAVVTDEDVWSALRQAQLEAVVQGLNGKLDEPLHELTQLSTGQKQRLAIARAILRKPAWLVLDEASANLDAVTEENFIESVRALIPTLTTVVISHKPSFNRIATHTLHLTRY